MSGQLTRSVRAGWLSRELGLELMGPDREIKLLCSLDALEGPGLSFVMRHKKAPAREGTVFALPAEASNGLTVIASENPRFDFIRAQYLLERAPGYAVDATPPVVPPSARVGRNVVIDNGVRIGEGTRVGDNVVIRAGTRIGSHCEIKAGAVIGEPGFGFERDAEGRPVKMIHLGGVRIGDHVEIGSLTTVCRGALSDTVLESHVKLDDHVHIAHNCFVGEGTLITACAELSGGVHIGRNCWVAPNCSMMQKIHVGDESFVGIGAVVLRDVEAGTKIFGNPAKKVVVRAEAADGAASAAKSEGPEAQKA